MLYNRQDLNTQYREGKILKPIARIICLLTLVSIFLNTSAAFASESDLREIFKNAFYGGATGSLVGAALLVFTKKPADHLEYIAYGAAGGVIAGTAYGLVRTSRSLAEYENGKVRFAIPAVTPDILQNPATKQTNITWRANILSGTFN